MREDRPPETSFFTVPPSGLFDREEPGSPQLTEPSGPPRYRVGPELGRGGMGVVTLAFDEWLHRDVALKRPHGTWGDALHARILNEARLTARLHHPGIALLLDVGHDDQGPFYTMPVLVGQPMHALITSGEWPLGDGVRALVAAASALQYAHEQGVIHGDVNPRNLFVGHHGEVWVLDWGLARDAGQPTDGRAGTEGYIAPECGTASAAPSADVFAFGRLLEAVLDGADRDATELRSVVVQCCQDDPRERWSSMQMVAAALVAWQDGRPVDGHAYQLSTALRLWITRHRGLLSVLLVALTAGVVTAAATLDSRLRTSRANERALATVLGIRAETERVAGRQPEAEILAAKAYALTSDPVAAGVLTSRSPTRPVLVGTTAAPCPRPTLDPTGLLVCVSADEAVVFHPDGTEQSRWAIADPALGVPRRAQRVGDTLLVEYADQQFAVHSSDGASVGFVPHDGPLHFTDQAGLLRGERSFATVGEEGVRWHAPLCEERVESVYQHGETFIAACRRGDIVHGTDGAWTRQHLDVHPHRALVSTRGTLVVTTWDGQLGTRSDEDGWSWRSTGVGAVADLVVLDADRLFLVGETGQSRLLALDTVGVTGALPGPIRATALHADGLVTLGRSVQRWTMGEPVPMAFDQAPEGGVSTLDLSPDGTELLVGHATGLQGVLTIDSGHFRPWMASGQRVAKGGVFLDANRLFLLNDGVRHIVDRQTETVTRVPGSLLADAVPFEDDLLTIGWGSAAFASDPGHPIGDVADAQVFDGQLYVLFADGRMVVYDRPSASAGEPLFTVAPAGRFGLTTDGIVVADRDTVRTYDWQGRPRSTLPSRRPVSALAVSDRFIVAGDRRGGIVVYAGDQLVADVPTAHQRLVSQLILANDQLYSASFDGFVRRWDLGTLTPDDPITAQAAIVESWGVDADAVLQR